MLKVKINTRSLKLTEEKTRKVFENVIRNNQMLNDMGTTIVEDIQFQTKRGKSIPNDLKPFRELTPKWINKRKQISNAQSVSDVFSPKRSNLSLSGQLLDSLQYKIIGAGKITFSFFGIHKPYKYQKKNGDIGKIGKQIENKKLAQYVEEQGRPFMGVRDIVKERLKRTLLGYIRRSANVFKFIND